MAAELPFKPIDLGEGFFNIRGSFRIKGLVDIGTHVSLVRRKSGAFVFLDSYTLSEEAQSWVKNATKGTPIEAIIHLHPFHTVHTRRMHALYPEAKLYGTERHHTKFPDLPWESERTEDAQFHERFEEDFRFFVPEGVHFIPRNENLHFSSVIALHHASQTIHVDDTLVYVRLPGPLAKLKRDVLRFHPTLKQVLKREPNAASEFRAWAQDLIEATKDVYQLAAAHSGTLRARSSGGAPISERIDKALQNVQGVLDKHQP